MLDVDKALEAIAAVETNSGANDYPRFEKAFAPRGKRFTIQGRIITGTATSWNPIVAKRWDTWGMSSACSYGAHQILYHTAADLGYKEHPAGLWADSDECERWVRRQVDRLIHRDAILSIEELADAWNSGSAKDRVVPQDYIDSVRKAYALL